MATTLITVRPQGGSLELTLSGDLDRAATHKVVETVEEYTRRGVQDIDVDLHDVSSIDTLGVKALLCCMRSSRLRGGRLRLARPSRPVRKTFSILHLDSFLDSET